jgi:tetratricopeptide (TPR) repeat protein
VSIRGWLLATAVLSLSGAPIARAQAPAAKTAATMTQLQALVDAGRYVDAEQQGLARVAALDSADPASQRKAATVTDLDIADTLDLVVLARHLGRRLTQPDTVQLAERALHLKETALAQDDLRVAATLVLLGLGRAAHRHPDEGQADVKRALAIRERELGAEHLDVANALNALAWIERSRNNDATATPFAWRAYDIARRAEQPAGRETETALIFIGMHMRSTRETERAIGLFEEALAIEERLYGPAHAASVVTLTQLGMAYYDNGDFARGMATRARAISLLEATPGSELRLAFELMSDSAWLAGAGNFAGSLAAAERAVAVAERVSGPNSALTAGALEQLAAAYERLGDDATAATIGRRTVALWTTTQGPDAIHTATAWRALAESYEHAGQIDAAFAAIAHAVSSPSLAKEYVLFAQALQVQARLLMSRGRFDEARTVLERARRVSESGILGAARTDLATTLLLLARVERHDGQLARALPLYREAVIRYELVFGYAHPTVADCRIEFAGALAEAGELYEAWQLLASGEQGGLDHLRLVARTLTDQASLSFAASRRSGIDLAVSLAVSPLPHPEESLDISRAFDMLVRARTVVLDEIAARQRAVAEQAHDAQVRTRGEALARARTRLANAIVRGPGDQSTTEYQTLIDNARTARDQAERDLAQASATFRQEQQRSRAGRAAVLAHLPPGAAIVSYVRYTPLPLPRSATNAERRRLPATPSASAKAAAVTGDTRGSRTAVADLTSAAHIVADRESRTAGLDVADRADTSIDGSATLSATPPAAYAAFVMRAGRETVTVVPLGAAPLIDAAIDAWRSAVRQELTSAGLAARRNEAAYRDAGAALRALVWDPVSSRLAAASTVFVVPDGALHQVDLATLPVGRTAYLADAPFVLHYLLAERDLVQPSPPSSSASLLALGAPDFDRVDREALANLAASAAVADIPLRAEADSTEPLASAAMCQRRPRPRPHPTNQREQPRPAR